MVMDSSRTKMPSYPTRLFLWLLCYSVLMVGCFVIFQYIREKTFKSTELNGELQVINRTILSDIAEGASLDYISHVNARTFPGIRISIIDNDGFVVYDNTVDTLANVNHLNRVEVAQAVASGSGYAVRRVSQSTGETYFYSATRGDDGTIVRTSLPYNISLDSLLHADYGFLWIMGFIASAMCIIGYFSTRRIGQHIVRLKQFAENAEKGTNFSDTPPFPNDELGAISNHIVRLYADLQRALSARDREHRKALHEHQEKERIKRQLTNNINHELKTPVAGIEVCLETLLAHPNIDPDKRIEFLERSMSNCERLKHLLADVSLITRIEDGDEAIVRERVNLAAIISDAINEKREIALKKGIVIENSITEPLPIIGNQTLLLSIFNNLIDNAIAYSCGSRIAIALPSKTTDFFVVSFSDNGIGVPEVHLPRLFERFYRIDKGRSRSAGGTGLGLAIVKNAVISHNGSITVANLNSGGLSFRLRFPFAE